MCSSDLPVATMYTGHGADLVDIVPLIDARKKRQHDQALALYELIERDEVTPLEATSRFYPRVYQKQFGLTLSKTIGALDYLESLGMIEKTQRAGIYYYKRVK